MIKIIYELVQSQNLLVNAEIESSILTHLLKNDTKPRKTQA